MRSLFSFMGQARYHANAQPFIFQKGVGRSHTPIFTRDFHTPTMFQRRKSREDSLEEALPVYTTSSYSPTTNIFPTPTNIYEKQPLTPLLGFQSPIPEDTSTVGYTDDAFEKQSFLKSQIKTILQSRPRRTLAIFLSLLIIVIILFTLNQYTLEGWSESSYFLRLGKDKVKDSLAAYYHFPGIF